MSKYAAAVFRKEGAFLALLGVDHEWIVGPRSMIKAPWRGLKKFDTEAEVVEHCRWRLGNLLDTSYDAVAMDHATHTQLIGDIEVEMMERLLR